MNIADIVIVVCAAAAAYLGMRRGTIRQLSGLAGVVAGVFAAALLYDKLAFMTQDSQVRTGVLAAVLIGTVVLLADLFVVAGGWLQRRVGWRKLVGPVVDGIGSGVVSASGCVAMVWLAALLFGMVLPSVVQTQLRSSFILTSITQRGGIPPLINNVAQLLRPFGSPTVFAGQEPDLGGDTAVDQAFVSLDAAIAKATPSVVKVTSWGCGSISNGSGFVVAPRVIATNAHVVAGSDRLAVQSGDSSLAGSVVWFDPQLDFALLRIGADLPGAPLAVNEKSLAPGTIGGVMGYPLGGNFAAGDAILVQRLNADGLDIYGQQKVVRKIYALRGDVVPGNSGGPVINPQGEVVGIIFGHSVTQNKLGYAITAEQIAPAVKKAQDLQTAVSAGLCVAG